jgi:glyoxylase-like metal-dependent hydrolase (beta-lactamase superfamily II)/ferredoxin
MAKLTAKRTENIDGKFYVDSSCIDCDTCRWMAPEVFQRVGEQSAVYQQPNQSQIELKAMQALLSCPTASIGTIETPKNIQEVQETFPLPIEDNVYHCGYHSEASFGAASYFIQRPEGNILIDSPRFAPCLVDRLTELGGIEYLYLTHRDDIADHQKFHDHFNCKRILHSEEIREDTKDIEVQLSGFEPVELAPDLLIIPVPGHTKGHTVLLYRDKFLFTGDHLAKFPYCDGLYAFRRFCWYSWSEQILSMEKLAKYDFEWVLPGHGRRYRCDRSTMKEKIQECVAWMKQY